MSAQQVVICGRLLSAAYQEARHTVIQLHRMSHGRLNIRAVDVLDLDWATELRALERRYGAAAVGDCPDLVVYEAEIGPVARNVAELQAWAATMYQLQPQEGHIRDDFQHIAREAFRSYCRSRTKESIFVYMRFARDGADLGTIVFELFRSLAPLACENFRLLCTGEAKSPDGTRMHYLNTPIHRIVKGAWIQGGDIITGDGDGTQSAFGALFQDESFSVLHDRPGILSMANEGDPHTNGSQFFVTLRDLPYLDRRKVAFGRVVSGLDVLLGGIATADCCHERPDPLIVVADCGLYSFSD